MTKKNNEAKLVYVAVILVVTVLSVIIIVTGIAARRRGDDPTPPISIDTESKQDAHSSDKTQDETSRVPEVSKHPASSTDKQNESKKDDETKDVSVSDTSADDVMAEPMLPEFVSPAKGNVAKSHSETVLVYSLTMDDYRTHSGIDISGQAGDIVVASADGIVKSVYEDPMWGYCVSVVHEGDAVSYYKNLSADVIDQISVGESVKLGDPIGSIGESALVEIAEEPHLHFELKIGGISVDPLDYFEVPTGNATEE